MMDIKLHANARTTPAVRAEIQRSPLSAAKLARRFGVSETTVYKWRKAGRVVDASHRRHNLNPSTSPRHEAIIAELRRDLGLSLDDIVEVMNRCCARRFSRSAIHRCLRRLGLNRLPKAKRKVGVFAPAPFGYIHIDYKQLPKLNRKASYVFVAIERTTRYVFIRIVNRRDQHTTARCLREFLAECQTTTHIPVHTILTDNDGAFTDRFAVFKKNKPKDQPSGRHPFDVLCAKHAITHKLIRPYTPQTNGMVENYNRRLGAALNAKAAIAANRGRNKFHNHAERNAFITQFVRDYNRTRLKCLNYTSPIKTLYNLTRPCTFAGVAVEGKSRLTQPLRDEEIPVH